MNEALKYFQYPFFMIGTAKPGEKYALSSIVEPREMLITVENFVRVVPTEPKMYELEFLLIASIDEANTTPTSWKLVGTTTTGVKFDFQASCSPTGFLEAGEMKMKISQ